MLINNESDGAQSSITVFLLSVNNFRERHDIANAITRQWKNTNIGGGAMASTRLFKTLT